jgi:Periplasmic binding protein
MCARLGTMVLPALVAGLVVSMTAAPTAAVEPIKIGFGMGLTGGLAASGKAAVLGMKIWEDETNARGGLLGRPVKLIYYDDQSNPATVPGIFTKLLNVDKVDLVVGDYGANLLAPAMPVIIAHKMTFLGLFGLDVNREFHYERYFSMVPTGGPSPSRAFSEPFFKGWQQRRTRSPGPWRSSPPTPNIRITPPTGRAPTPRRKGSRSSTTRPIRRAPPTLPR